MAGKQLGGYSIPSFDSPIGDRKFNPIALKRYSPILDLYGNLGSSSVKSLFTKSHHCHFMSNFLSISMTVLPMHSPNHFPHTPGDETTGNAEQQHFKTYLNHALEFDKMFLMTIVDYSEAKPFT